MAVALCVAVGVGSAVHATPSLAAKHPALGVFGSASQPTFAAAQALAVDQNTGDVLVVDSAAGTVSRFHADGTPADFSALGSNVISGAGPAEETPLRFGSTAEDEVAVDSSGGIANGDIYVAQTFEPHVVDVFAEAGEYLGQLTEAGGHHLSEPCGVAVDSSGHVFVGDYAGQIDKYEPTLNLPYSAENIAAFETVEHPCTLSAGAGPTEGSLFVRSYEAPHQITKIDTASGKVDYVVAGDVTREGIAGSGVDPATGHLFVARGQLVKEFDVSGSGGPTLINTITEQSEVEAVAIDGASGHVYVAASTGSGTERNGASKLLEYGPLTSPPPKIEDQQVVTVAATEGILQATVSPEGSPTTLKVEYGLDSSYGKATTPISLGEGESPRSETVPLRGLSPDQTYHFRFVATNPTGTTVGSDETLRTGRPSGGEASCPNAARRTGPAARLADCRAYEMVTPVDKNNTDILTLLDVNSRLAELNQSAASGEALTYTTLQGFAETDGAPYVSQYIASRDGAGWTNSSITPPQGVSQQNPGKRIELEYQIFSPDLCISLLNHYTDPPLASDAIPGIANTYRRTNCGTPEYETVSTVYPGTPEMESEAPDIQGLSEDHRCALYSPGAGGLGLYEKCVGVTKQVNILPDGTPSARGFTGTMAEADSGQEFSLRGGQYQHAISADGSRVYWSSGSNEAPLYVRVNPMAEPSALGAGGECLESAKACTIAVSDESAKTSFWGASPDGARAIYSVAPPVEGEKQELYEFDLATGSSTLLANNVRGVMGVDEQATKVYFLSEESFEGQGTAGKPNLYLLNTATTGAGRYRFIATVSSEDTLLGGGNSGTRLSMVHASPTHHLARVSADGLHAVFSSYAPLTGYDNRDAVSGERDFEVFVYNALGNGGAGSLACVSCNPTGQRPHGINVKVESVEASESRPNWAAALVPPALTSFYASRAMSEDGSRVFFDSYDALLPSDTNGKEDVYEWEASGSGPTGAECTEASAAFSPASGGCLSLISSGESSSNSQFVDANPDGRDVFFKTAESLVSQDQGLIDIYDAREDGGFPPPPAQPKACEGAACQSTAAAAQGVTPASSTFGGPGNSTPPPTSKPKPLTRAQKLAKALKACKKVKNRKKLTLCEKQARKKYGPRKAAKGSSRRQVGNDGRVVR
ncbi:MAG TPA: hypothetical protein VH061_04360 [Solirubrobacteraceae bacterium]|jgi:hypothetical protein|nr:hypothetical protein [Solirubrobacteraceae bacterium]